MGERPEGRAHASSKSHNRSHKMLCNRRHSSRVLISGCALCKLCPRQTWFCYRFSISISIFLSIYLSIYPYSYTYVSIYLSLSIYTHTCVCVHIYQMPWMCMRLFKHAHTYTNTNINMTLSRYDILELIIMRRIQSDDTDTFIHKFKQPHVRHTYKCT